MAKSLKDKLLDKAVMMAAHELLKDGIKRIKVKLQETLSNDTGKKAGKLKDDV